MRLITRMFAWLLLSDRLNTRDMLGIGRWKGNPTVCYAPLEHMRTWYICSSLGISVSGSGTTCKSYGFNMMICRRLSLLLRIVFRSLFSWRSLSLLAGIYGCNGTVTFSEISVHLSLNGKLVFCMTCLCLGIVSRESSWIALQSG